ncbi:MAG: amidohydrolase family protein [Muribaculaceae bacterium]|nr:amidohydrolase family protein [Muribaculaceae bacterium]
MKKILLPFLALAMLCSCSNIPSGGADLVVIGNIYTSDPSAPTAEAFVVHEGKYIYVGTREDAMKYVKEGKTQVIDSDAAMIMAGCTEGHGHYITEAMFKQLCYLKSDSFEGCVKEIKDYYEANKGQVNQIFGYGWFEANMEDRLPEFRKALDNITTDIPIFICDREMHQGWVNSKALEMAELKDDSSKKEVDMESIPGGTVYRDSQGVLLGRVQDQACGYLRKAAFGALVNHERSLDATKDAQNTLLAMGYTNYQDAWLSYDNTDDAYKALHELDSLNQLHMNVVGCYEIDSYKIKSASDYEKYVAEALSWKNMYSSTHFMPTSVKLFEDGCTESFKGYVIAPYPATNDHGSHNWEQTMLNDIVKHINSKGLLVHTHCYGDSAVKAVVDAYVASYDAGNHMRNSLGHAASVTDEDMKRIAQYGIGVAENFCWHTYSSDEMPLDTIYKKLGKDLYESMYPMKRFYDNNIQVCSSTDAPCSVGYPSDPFGIMEMMVTGINPLERHDPRNPADCMDIKQAIDAFTINGAWNLGLEKERGSITVGKYADFIFLDQDLLKVKPNALHDTHVTSTYFEGKPVYQRK